MCVLLNKDGIEAAAEIKAEFPDIKIIIVTSMVEVGYLKRARKQKPTASGIKISVRKN